MNIGFIKTRPSRDRVSDDEDTEDTCSRFNEELLWEKAASTCTNESDVSVVCFSETRVCIVAVFKTPVEAPGEKTPYDTFASKQEG